MQMFMYMWGLAERIIHYYYGEILWLKKIKITPKVEHAK